MKFHQLYIANLFYLLPCIWGRPCTGVFTFWSDGRPSKTKLQICHLILKLLSDMPSDRREIERNLDTKLQMNSDTLNKTLKDLFSLLLSYPIRLRNIKGCPDGSEMISKLCSPFPISSDYSLIFMLGKIESVKRYTMTLNYLCLKQVRFLPNSILGMMILINFP